MLVIGLPLTRAPTQLPGKVANLVAQFVDLRGGRRTIRRILRGHALDDP
ncbi:hypothetical protein [Mycolicibacterium murale]|jgi:hypothetical protein|nr:hypothetical protein [Mycolicibacterium murale]MCV7184116.1 hypothetical protein [Mycolicibacterium murale]